VLAETTELQRVQGLAVRLPRFERKRKSETGTEQNRESEGCQRAQSGKRDLRGTGRSIQAPRLSPWRRLRGQNSVFSNGSTLCALVPREAHAGAQHRAKMLEFALHRRQTTM
jgi:hypothetical protein